MIISRTPFRISFFGGGTDYPVYFRNHPGAVLATSINKYCFITCRNLPPFFEYQTRVLYSRVETVKDHEEIRHPAVRETLRFLDMQEGLEIHHDGDMPARAGLGSSSSFTVGLLHALNALHGRMPSKTELARNAIHVEQNLIRENVGSQDQVTAAFGGLNRIDFMPDDTFSVRAIIIKPERLRELQSHLMLYFTGFARTASDVAKEQIANTPNRLDSLATMYDMVGQAIEILQGTGPIAEFGQLLHEAWQLKRGLTHQITTDAIDSIYARARAAGAIGGKLIGAGGGGFMVLFVPPEHQARVRAALSGLLLVPFRFENQGSQIIFYDPESEYTYEPMPTPIIAAVR